MKILLIAVFFLPLLSLLSACSGPRKDTIDLTPPLQTAKDPDDDVLIAEIRSYIAAQKGPANARFQYARLDLNGDGLREGLVLFTLPYSHWCGAGGCSMSVFKAQRGGFTLLSEITRIRGPLLVSNSKTNGWRDIIVRVSGINMSDKDVALRFDGQRYPGNPITQTETQTRMRNIAGKKLFP